MDWWNLGVGIGGLVAGSLGLFFAYLAHRSAELAKGAAISAEDAANAARIEARQALSRNLSSIDVERAVALIGRLKDIHDRRNWDYALGIYPDLRRTLSQIGESIPVDLSQYGSSINRAVPQITAMENLVRRSREENESGEPEDISSLDETLNEIQQDLETLQSNMMYSDERLSS